MSPKPSSRHVPVPGACRDDVNVPFPNGMHALFDAVFSGSFRHHHQLCAAEMPMPRNLVGVRPKDDCAQCEVVQVRK